MAVSVMFSMSGVNKQRFIDAVKADPQTYADWSGNGEWDYETTGKEDKLFSPFLRKPFQKALEAGIIPPIPQDHRRHLGHGDRPGRPDLSQPGARARDRRHRSQRSDGRRDPRAARGDLRDRGAAQVHAGLRERQAAQLRHDARHARHPQDRCALQPHRQRRARAGALRRRHRHISRVHRWLRHPDPADYRALLARTLPCAGAQGRVATCWWQAAASAAITSRTPRRAT